MSIKPVFNGVRGWRHRPIGLGLLSVALVWSTVRVHADQPATRPAADKPLLSADETKDVDGLIKLLITAGFPDATGATVYRGTIHVSATFDASKKAPPLPTDRSGMQETIPGKAAVKYGFDFDGVHFKLPDGTWIISMAYQFKPAGRDAVNVSDATEVNLETLTADAMADAPFDPDKYSAKYLAMIPAKNRDRTRASLVRFAPVSRYLKLTPDDLAPAVVLLHQAGWHDADDLAFMVTDYRAKSYWQQKPWTTPDQSFDPTGKYPGYKDEETNWQKAQKELVSEPVATGFRRAMFRWCRAQLTRIAVEDCLLPRKVSAACAKAMVDPTDPQKNTARIDLLAAASDLPDSCPADAKLAQRLQTWEAQPRMPRMVVNGGGNGGNASISTGFVAPKPGYQPDKADLDELIKLLGDDRPSRWFDFTGDRTVGDNAFRAVTELLKTDPRELAKYPTDKPWTTDERHAAAKAVAAWWKDHRGDYVDK